MQWLAQISVKRPVFATVIILAIVVIGVVGYGQLSVDRFPKVDFPVVAVTTVLPGASPEEVESELSDPIEQALGTIEGIEQLRSISSESVSIVMVQFRLDKDVEVAAQEVRDRLNGAVSDLPEGVELPKVTKMDSSSTPILAIALEADAPLRAVTEVADRLVRRRLETASGVGQVAVLGGTRRQIQVWLDPLRLRAAGLTVPEVERAIAAQNLTIPGGPVETGREQVTLRIRGRVERAAELERLVLRTTGEHPVRLGDVARVEDGAEEPESLALHDGKRTVVLTVRKQSGTSSVEVVDAVLHELDKLPAVLPAGYHVRVIRDDSQTIRTSVAAVEEHLVMGALFAALAVLLFLGNLRSTVIAAIAIPVSIVGTFAMLWWKGLALDTVTLLALALAVGIVIDDAIVVLENVVRFVEEKRMTPREATIAATKEIGLAVLATTLSLIAVFLPVAFMSGVVGRFLESFGLTMAFSIGISLLVSFTLTPMLSSRWLRPIAAGATGRSAKPPLLERVVDTFYRPLERVYLVSLKWAMRHRWVVVTLAVATLATIPPLASRVPKGLLPDSDEAQFDVAVRTPEGTSLEATAVEAERLARRIRGLPEVETTLVTIGDERDHASNKARIYVHLTAPEERERDQFQIMQVVRERIAARAPRHLKIAVSPTAMFEGGQQTVVNYELRGPELERLGQYADRIVSELAKTPGAVDVDSSLVTNRPELEVRIDRERAAARGVAVADVARTLRTMLTGSKVTDFDEGGERYEVRARAERQFRSDPEALALVGVPSARGDIVPLRDIVTITRTHGPAAINRSDRQRQVTITANVAEGYTEGDVIASLERIGQNLALPAGYRLAPIGRSEEMEKTGRAFMVAFLLSFVFMYLVLAAQFESWLHPLTILLCLPLTLPFALVSLLLLGQSLDIYSMLGILVLFGVVKKNSILQIDQTNRLRARGMARLDAILEANRERLRPILMTTVAFVAGMLPLTLSVGVGAGYNRATAGVIVGGQVLSLLLTLLATPVAYSLFDDAGAWARRLVGRVTAPRRQSPSAALETSGVAISR